MESILEQSGAQESTVVDMVKCCGGKQIRIPTATSKSNFIYRKRRNERICNQFISGNQAKEIAEKFKLSFWTIQNILKENNIKVRGERKRTLKEEVKAMLEMGYNKTEIARKLDKSRQWIHEVIKEEGL